MSDSFWWCNRCLSRVECEHVAFHEYHDGCGGTCEVLDEEPDVFAAARAWQAFRDFLNGTPEQWQASARAAYWTGYDSAVEWLK